MSDALLDTLRAEREIYRALVAIARAMDDRDWEAFGSILLPDATADLGTGTIAGREAIVSFIRGFLDACGTTQHLLGNVLIDVRGDEASSRAYVSDMHKGAGEKSHLTFSTLGDYQDQWRRVGGVWRLKHRKKHNRATLGDISIFDRGSG
jgi:hypothetical protein